MDRKSGFSIRFDRKFLETLIKSNEKGAVVEKCRYHIALHPAQLRDFRGALNDEIGQKIAKYDKKFSGILLGFKNVTPISTLGHIGSDNIFIHLDIEAEFFIFRPAIGMVLNGVVTKSSKEHVGCLVYKTFNVSLPMSAVEQEHDERWLGSKVKAGDQVSFEIVFLDLESRLPYIRGKILSIDDNSEDTKKQNKGKTTNKNISFELEAEEQEQDQETSTKRKKDTKKNKDKDLNNEIEETSETYIQNDESYTNETPVKKKKKRKHIETETSFNNNLEQSEVTTHTEYETPKKKKKQKKQHDELFNDSSALENDKLNYLLGSDESSTPKKMKKHKNNPLSNETNEESTFDAQENDSKYENEDISPKKKKHKNDSLNNYVEPTPNNLEETIETVISQSILKKKQKKQHDESFNDSSALENDTSNYLLESDESSTPKKKKKHKNNPLSNETNEFENEGISPKKKKHKNYSLNHFVVQTPNTLEETIETVICQSVLNYDTEGEDNSTKKKRLKKNSVTLETNNPSLSQNLESPKEKLKLDVRKEAISPIKLVDKNSEKSKKQKLIERRMSVSGNMISSINPVDVYDISIQRRLSLDSHIENDKPKKKSKGKTTDFSNLNKTIEEVIQRVCSDNTNQETKEPQKEKQNLNLAKNADSVSKSDLDLQKERDLLIKKAKKIERTHTNSFSDVSQSDLDLKKERDTLIKKAKEIGRTHTNSFSASKSVLDLENERNNLIRKAKEIGRTHTNSFSDRNASDSSVERIGQIQKSIKREFKTPVRELSSKKVLKTTQSDSDSSIEKIRNNLVKQKTFKREPKTPVRDLSPEKTHKTTNKREIIPPIENPKESNSNQKSAKKDINTPEKSAQNNNPDPDRTTSVKKTRVNGIAGSMSDWEVEDFSRRKKVVNNPKPVEKELNKVKEEVVSEAETLKKKKKRNSDSFFLKEEDLDHLFSSPSVKLEPTTDEEKLKKKRRKSLSRSIDYKDIKMEQNSDIDDIQTFSLSKNKSLSELGLHTEIDLGIKTDEDLLEQLGIS